MSKIQHSKITGVDVSIQLQLKNVFMSVGKCQQGPLPPAPTVLFLAHFVQRREKLLLQPLLVLYTMNRDSDFESGDSKKIDTLTSQNLNSIHLLEKLQWAWDLLLRAQRNLIYIASLHFAKMIPQCEDHFGIVKVSYHVPWLSSKAPKIRFCPT